MADGVQKTVQSSIASLTGPVSTIYWCVAGIAGRILKKITTVDLYQHGLILYERVHTADVRDKFINTYQKALKRAVHYLHEISFFAALPPFQRPSFCYSPVLP